jgi:hypothetical protein
MKSSSLRESLALTPAASASHSPSTLNLHQPQQHRTSPPHTQDVQRTSSPRAHTHELHALSPITALLLTPLQLAFPAQGARCQCHFTVLAHTLRARLHDNESDSDVKIEYERDYECHACAQQERVVTFSAIIERRIQQAHYES